MPAGRSIALHDVAMLRRFCESRELQPPLRQKDRLSFAPERFDRVVHRRDFDPAVALLLRPWASREDDKRRPSHATGGKRIGRHARGEGMRCVDDGVDALGLEIRCKALGAAEAADPLRDRRGRGVRGRAGERDERRDAGLIRQAASRARWLPTFRRE